MTQSEQTNYSRIAEAIDYIRLNFKNQPSLDQIAEKVHLSPFHFQRMFTDWAGVSPKKFLQYISVEYAKDVLSEKHASLFDAAHEAGLSGTGRLHDLFVQIEGMTPGEYKNGGAELNINYSYADTPFGRILVASTSKGICHMTFSEDEICSLLELKGRFPNAVFRPFQDSMQQNALNIFKHDWTQLNRIKLHLKGTAFQLKVWEALLTIPMGNLTSYGSIADKVSNPNASRAVGTAIGLNPVAFLIPCHRVIQAGGASGGYMWGLTRKSAIIGWEAARINSNS
jgi:AraC family transcriptional regulator of adaptative response/methylated-DNA-[protein]-cysteine methyltransferase